MVPDGNRKWLPECTDFMPSSRLTLPPRSRTLGLLLLSIIPWLRGDPDRVIRSGVDFLQNLNTYDNPNLI